MVNYICFFLVENIYARESGCLKAALINLLAIMIDLILYKIIQKYKISQLLTLTNFRFKCYLKFLRN